MGGCTATGAGGGGFGRRVGGLTFVPFEVSILSKSMGRLQEVRAVTLNVTQHDLASLLMLQFEKL